MWHKKLTVAIIEKNFNNMEELIDNPPIFGSKKEINSAILLVDEAIEIIKSAQTPLSVTLIKMKNQINYLKSTQSDPRPTLDIVL